MSLLIRSNFKKLFLSRIFYYLLFGFMLFGAAVCVLSYFNADIGKNPDFSICPISVLLMLPITSAAFAGIFISADFTFGTIRNKLIVGHSRKSIYFADVITVSAAVLMFYIAYEVVAFVLGAVFFNLSAFSAETIVKELLVIAVLLTANTFVSVAAVYMVKDTKSTILAFMLQYALMFAGMPMDMGGTIDKVFKVFSRFSPQGLAFSMTISDMPEKIWLNILCTVAFGIVSTIGAVYYFNKCDLK